MYPYKSIRRVHLEITTKCNAACPQCPRNVDGGPVNPNLPLIDLSLAEIQTIFPPVFLQQLDQLNFCGNYGDPSVARDLIPVCEYMRSAAPNLRLTLHSNGSARTPAWWAQLATLVDNCTFAIDGLEDTNHLYRRNTIWSSIMANAAAFIQAGGAASWDFLVFEHNQHQVEAARALSLKMGFHGFDAKRTGRFLKDNTLLRGVQVRDPHGALVQILRPPTRKRLRNPTSRFISKKYSSPTAYETYLATTPVTCNAQRNAEIFISAEGLVLPCCWMAQLYPTGPMSSMSQRKRQMHDLLKTLPEGRNSIDAHLHPLREILATSLFQRDIPDGWEPGTARLRVCAKFCGQHGVSAEQQLRPHSSPLHLLARLAQRAHLTFAARPD